MEIRDVTERDFEAIASLMNRYVDTPVNFATQAVTADDARADWLATRDRYGFVVATDDDALVGFAKAAAFRTRPAYAWAAEVAVYVRESSHGRGVARALYMRLVDLCRRQGFHSLVAGIALPNEPSVALHERMGFLPVGVFREIGFKLGRYRDVGFWQLAISPSDVEPGPIKRLTELA